MNTISVEIAGEKLEDGRGDSSSVRDGRRMHSTLRAAFTELTRQARLRQLPDGSYRLRLELIEKAPPPPVVEVDPER